MANLDNRSLMGENYEEFKHNKALKNELQRLKSNFEIKLKAREAKVQKVSEE
jgi:hypothetical protein